MTGGQGQGHGHGHGSSHGHGSWAGAHPPAWYDSPVTLDTPGFVVGAALAAGILSQALARHLAVPGIVLLLAVGVALGPDGANVVVPDALGSGLHELVGFAVAVILFEGGLNLRLARLRRAGRALWQLLTLGVLITATGAALVAALALGWGWKLSLLFGTLVIVTGPTVVTPLLARLRAQRKVATLLEAEGVLIDAIGAIAAAVALEIVLRPTGESVALALPAVAGRLAFGAAVGVVGGGFIALLLRWRGLVPEGLENVFVLGFAMLIFQGSNVAFHESGIAAVTVAGIVVGNSPTLIHKELVEFKEQLTALLIGLLFVLLAADVRLDDVWALGPAALVVIAVLVLVVRPLAVAASAWGSDLTAKERIFVGWIGPRGIVAAAVASLFSISLDNAGVEGGVALRALVFSVIAVTVVWAGVTGPLVAMVLGLRRQKGHGWVLIGANPVGLALAKELTSVEEEVVLVDDKPDAVQAAEEAGFRAVLGNAIEHGTWKKAKLDTRRGAVATTSNEEVNLLFVRGARPENRDLRFLVALSRWSSGVTPEHVKGAGADVAFGGVLQLDAWKHLLENGQARVRYFRFTGEKGGQAGLFSKEDRHPLYLPLVRRRKRRAEPIALSTPIGRKDAVGVLVDEKRAEETLAALAERGWEPVDQTTPTED